VISSGVVRSSFDLSVVSAVMTRVRLSSAAALSAPALAV
jgi:hypothetical protein